MITDYGPLMAFISLVRPSLGTNVGSAWLACELSGEQGGGGGEVWHVVKFGRLPCV